MKKSGTIARVTEMSKCDFCLNLAEYYCKTKNCKTKMGMCKTHFEIYRNLLKLTEGLRKEVNKLQQDNEYLPLEKWIDKFNEQLAEIVLIKMNIENELKIRELFPKEGERK